jgi:hypothetical protein
LKPAGGLAITGLDGAPRQVATRLVDRFAHGLRGTVAYRHDGDYWDATRIWNGTIKKRPALVARAVVRRSPPLVTCGWPSR